jgi:hypothetical protein
MDAKTEPKRDPRDIALALLTAIAITPFTGMLRAVVYRLLWGWFLAAQYGAGPTLAAWFGIGLLMSMLTVKFDSSESTGKPVTIGAVLETAFAGALWQGTIIVAAVLARGIWGW